MSVHRRFYTALALHDLVNEIPLAAVAKKFGCSRGMLQSLQQSAATFAGGYYANFFNEINVNFISIYNLTFTYFIHIS
jgi:DNA polymerase theta